MEVRLRKATIEDVPSLDVVRRQAIEHGFTGEYNRAQFAGLVAGEDENLAEWIQSDTHHVTVVDSEVTVLAYGVYDRAGGRVLSVYTAPAYEGEGWGTRVLERFEVLARDSGIESVEAMAPRNAVAFFAANGFEKVGRVERDRLTLTKMRKLLE